MLRKIISTIVASAMVISVSIAPSFAAIYTQSSPSLIEINNGIQAGTGFEYYPVSKESGAQPTGFILSGILPEGTALPMITDAQTLLDALNDDETVLVASGDFFFMIPEVYVILAQQNGITAEEMFMYISGLTHDQFIEMAMEQTQAIVEVLGLNEPTVVVEVVEVINNVEVIVEVEVPVTVIETVTETVFITLPAEVREIIIDNTDYDTIGQLQATITTLEALNPNAIDVVVALAQKNMEIAALEEALANAPTQDNLADQFQRGVREGIASVQPIITALTAQVQALQGNLSLNAVNDILSDFGQEINNLDELNDALDNIEFDAFTNGYTQGIANAGTTITEITEFTGVIPTVTASVGIVIGNNAPSYSVSESTTGLISNLGGFVAYFNLESTLRAAIWSSVETAYYNGYNDGYTDGYSTGYVDGYNQAVTDSQ